MQRTEFERLAVDQMDAVYRMAMHLTRNSGDAEDLVQDVYLRALKTQTWQTFEDRAAAEDAARSGEGMRAWLFTITHNTFYSRLRKQRRTPDLLGEADERLPDPDPPDHDREPPAWDLAAFDWEQVDGGLKRAVEDLRPEYREVLLMWGVEGMKYRQIAQIVGVPIGTVMSRLHRARATLAAALEKSGVTANLGVRETEGMAGA
ncbi:MAG: sigma-70 family RNA polymerase sigma factor [Phycisphaerae bacterium]|nr:sigma-70 family RNA polymerase sigma factor [Phycisphaerae bacterium]